ncbi:hypothetical protein TRFO_18548 [Tritrichomonas foetus]|uniref:Uncharacterized protein n=1 Tax=Tritrichomonas foetus TaxID=1144522 RepID=A0A1J4KKP0_9EUKA|nr:hypothetical protein TRFO_18548 [Tritrichomonas foetus]|eukprot:OHT11863.1 hypothetical protein TRFO_18548 [Tritrichomonas foetus]
MEKPKVRPQTELEPNVPNIKIRNSSGQSTPRKTARSETARRIKVSDVSSPIPSGRGAFPQSTRVSKSSKRASTHIGFTLNEIRTTTDLKHNRFIAEQLAVSKKPFPVLQTLEQMINSIPVDLYDESNCSVKLQIIKKLIDAYNFAWNEVVIQIKELSEEHAIVLAKLKNFYNSLFYDYPKLLESFDEEVSDLRTTIMEKDQCISSLTKQIGESDGSFSAARDFLFGIQRELEEVTARKDFIENELNQQVLLNEDLQSQLTDLRCIIIKQKEAITRLYKIQESADEQTPEQKKEAIESLELEQFIEIERKPRKPSETKVIYKDACTDTSGLYQDDDHFDHQRISLKQIDNMTLIESDELFDIEAIHKNTTLREHAPLRKIIHSFMKSDCKEVDSRIIPDQVAELKKYVWVYPKLISIFLNGFRYEDPEKPFHTFDDIVVGYFNHMYQTSFLSSQMLQSLVNSVQIFEKSDSAVRLFDSFLKVTYDFNQYRFLSCVLEYSINSTEPNITSLIGRESLNPSDTHVIIKRNKAREIYQSIFPVDDVPKWISDSIIDPYIEYWEFLENCIKKFDDHRKHFWAVVKNGLLLSDCSDSSHITFKHIKNFFGIALPSVSHEEVKEIWNELIIRNKATERRGDMLDLEGLTYYLTQKEDLLFEIVQRKTASNFTAKYFEMNGSLLNAVSFIVKRIVYYIPIIEAKVRNKKELFLSTGASIRQCLFMCDVAGSFAHYRMLLHLIDDIHVRNCMNLKLTNNSTDDEVDEFLDHFETREKAVGIIPLTNQKNLSSSMKFASPRNY